MSEVCKACPAWNKGRGSQRCISRCKEYTTISTRSKPCVDYIQVPSEILENLSLDLSFDYYSILDYKDATLLFQRYHLKMTLKEMGDYHNISPQAVDKKNKRLLNVLNDYKINKLT